MTTEFTATAEFENISVALKSLWEPFNQLREEIASFVPRTLSEYDDERKIRSANIKNLNPNSTDEEIQTSVERSIESSQRPDWQFFTKFHNRIMTMDVTVTLLAQALCEAEINAILAIGFHGIGLAEQFVKIQKSDIRTKWLEHPKNFCPKYELNKDSELYRTLDHLIEHRNSWMHHKIHLSVGEEKVIEGSKLQVGTYQEKMYWLSRYFSLPYDLASHAYSYTHQMMAVMMSFTRNPIPVADAHQFNLQQAAKIG